MNTYSKDHMNRIRSFIDVSGQFVVAYDRSYSSAGSAPTHDTIYTPVERWARFLVRETERRLAQCEKTLSNFPKSYTDDHVTRLEETRDEHKQWVELFDSFSE